MNRLASETSPYLLQHKNNPVDWYPWGQEALDRARVDNKPILLSIGYSACHWCHVMEHESFENPTTAALMNDRFVCIKVDREERPDLDHIYQNVAQALTRSGGWPLTVFLTPELKPFFGGTYFPPEDRYGRAGFPRVLEALSKAYREDAVAVAENADQLTTFIRGMDQVPDSPAVPAAPSMRALALAAHQIAGRMDPVLGGLSGAPKFPNPMLLSFLARFSALQDESSPLEALHVSLERMAAGGIFDQLGGGFHRYSVDETWSVPHFEKMLYDNGLLLRVYSEALLLSGEGLSAARRWLYLRTLRMTVQYLLREMQSPEGAFYAAQDADSEGEEGKFFAWTPKELNELVAKNVISDEGARAFAASFGVTDTGNFEHGMTVLFLKSADTQDPTLLEETCRKLFEVRSARVAPATDRKCLASWNGLVISGLSWAAQALEANGDLETATQARQAATRAFDCVVAKMSRPEGRLFATLQEGSPKFNGYLDDYAFMAMAALDLSRFEAASSQIYLDQARQWIDTVLARFDAGEAAGYYFTSTDHESLIHRPKTVFDQAIPSGTAVALTVMVALGDLLANGSRFSQEASKQLARLGALAEKAPAGLGELLCASLLALRGPITVQGAPKICRHPHVFQKPSAAGSPILVCHQGTCSLPQESLARAQACVAELLVRSSP